MERLYLMMLLRCSEFNTMSITSSEPAPTYSLVGLPDVPPWMDIATFPVPPMPLTFGYRQDKTSHRCSQPALIDQIQRDTNKKIALVWTPEASHLLPPEELPWLFEALRVREYAYLKQARFYAIVNTVLWGMMLALSAASRSGIAQFQLFTLVALGIIPLLEHSWNLYHVRFYTPQTMVQRVPEARYTAWLGRGHAPWTWALVICIACVGLVQFLLGLWFFLDPTHSSIAAAGIVKPAIRAGELWRLLTGTLLHASIMHFVFNIAALFVLGKMLEVTFHRAYVPIIFVLTALSGSLWSLVLLPNTTSVGASGGIMGLLGFVLVLGWRHRQSFPHAIRRSLLISVAYIIVAGLLASQAIDNPAHVGGLIAGVILGMVFTRHHHVRIPDQVSPLVSFSSIIASGIILATTVGCLVRILGI
jgi:membrane associated rhomboid family serine protease